MLILVAALIAQLISQDKQYDCSLAALATALIPKDCSKKAFDYSGIGVSSNFRKFRTIKKIEEKEDIIEYYNLAVEEWATEGIVPLESDVIYKGKSMEAFANMIHYKSIAFGCMHKNCDNDGANDDKSFAIACVYGSAPKIGEPLYIPNPKPKNKKGCTAHKTCKEVFSDDRCMTNEDSTLGPLCESNPTEVDVETTSSAASTQTPSTSDSNYQYNYDNNHFTYRNYDNNHFTYRNYDNNYYNYTNYNNNYYNYTNYDNNYYNYTNYDNNHSNHWDDSGNARQSYSDDKLSQRYDMTLEAEAQAVADTCQDIASGLATTFGQNAYVMSSVTLPLYDVLVETQKVWWSQITKNGNNAQMHYTQFLETKPLSPNAFTQMAWAKSYKVGCGIKRCSFGTSVVCRYSPR